MKLTHTVVLGALMALPGLPVLAAERETLSIGRATADAKKLESFLFPEAQCENVKYQCLAVRPTTERSIGMDVKFQTGSADLTPDAKAQLENLGKVLASRKGKLNPGEIVIEGHADARGSADYNKKLSEQRAASVAKHLVSAHGVESTTLKPVGMGKDQLKDPTHPDAPVNRRVELVRKPN
jgi:outer membrane protein OmpA-like peptidoglycan-associated protein